MTLETPAGPVRAVLLDMGGVLLDMLGGNGLPTEDLAPVCRERLRRHLAEQGGKALDEETIDHLLFGPWGSEYARRYERRQEAAWEPHLARLAEAAGYAGPAEEILGAWIGPYLDAVNPLPGVSGAVETLARRVPLALVSNGPAPGRFYRETLARFDLAAPFRALLYSYDEGSRKPEPAMIERALERLGVPPAEALMVGDRRDSDVAAGKAAGTRTAWLESDRDDGPEPDLVAKDLPGLVELLG